jgi:hypothetical protein
VPGLPGACAQHAQCRRREPSSQAPSA